MRAVTALFFVIASIFGGAPVVAQDRPVVVVELFTSQGCSSCPPADAFLGELASQPAILPLALHVDYWDYIGWKDTFARAAHTKRQKAYAYGFGTRSVYTPQMVIGGVEHTVGSNVMKVMEILHRHQNAAQTVLMKTVQAEGGLKRLRIESMTHLELPKNTLIQIVRFIPRATIAIKRGENAGRSVTSTNIVTDISGVGNWNGEGAAEFDLPAPIAPDGQAAAVLLQAATSGGYPGQILAAIRLD